MRKSIQFILILGLITLAVSCGKKDEEVAPAPAPAVPAPVQATGTCLLNQPIPAVTPAPATNTTTGTNTAYNGNYNSIYWFYQGLGQPTYYEFRDGAFHPVTQNGDGQFTNSSGQVVTSQQPYTGAGTPMPDPSYFAPPKNDYYSYYYDPSVKIWRQRSDNQPVDKAGNVCSLQ